MPQTTGNCRDSLRTKWGVLTLVFAGLLAFGCGDVDAGLSKANTTANAFNAQSAKPFQGSCHPSQFKGPGAHCDALACQYNTANNTNQKNGLASALLAADCARLAEVSTLSVTNIEVNEATLHGDVYDRGVPNPEEHGFCYGQMSAPSHTNGAICTTLGGTSSTGVFSQNVTGLEEDTQYFVRAYATTIAGVSYGNEVAFQTLSLCVGSDFLVGNGTAADPYEICNADQLNQIGATNIYNQAHFLVVADIDLADVDFSMIDDFEGVFDGDGHAISNLTLDNPTENNVGLFSLIRATAEVKNVRLVNVNVTGNVRVGGLIGQDLGGRVENSSSSGNVSGVSQVGGLVGRTGSNSIVVGCSSSAGVFLSHANGGGLVGLNLGAIENSAASGDVEGLTSIGGITGANLNSIRLSFATGKIAGDFAVGGLVGNVHEQGIVAQSYATGDVVGSLWVGGLAGNLEGEVHESYATGNVSGDSFVGALAGDGSALNILSSYWNLDSTCSADVGACNTLGTGLTAAQMGDEASFVGWVFAPSANYVWTMPVGGPPKLYWE